jgi:uncharacterized protein (TIGR00255 family)
MTGFGRAEGLTNDRKVTVEIRSLNSKQLDLQLKLPSSYRDRDAELRSWANERIGRGKAEVIVHAESVAGASRNAVNTDLVRSYYEELRTVAHTVAPDQQTDLLGLVLRMPDVIGSGRSSASDEEWKTLMRLVEKAMAAFQEFRAAEGAKLRTDLEMRVHAITKLLTDLEVVDQGRIGRTRERLQARLDEFRVEVDRDRFEQELVFYLEKMDINEEKVRLRTHCAYFLETLESEDQQGRKLGFIAQEMGREINTLGSKSNDATMQRSVVLMKDELEKIKEQVLNLL